MLVFVFCTVLPSLLVLEVLVILHSLLQFLYICVIGCMSESAWFLLLSSFYMTGMKSSRYSSKDMVIPAVSKTG